ncbi:MAG: hypothetical protein ABH883_08795 [Candidatus Omnitrophota bacterium]
MRKISIVIMSISFLMVSAVICRGESPIKVYTFKKERVDQDIKGNRGYVQGNVPDIKEKNRNSKRTLIGIDIELSGSDSGSDIPAGEETGKMTEEYTDRQPVAGDKENDSPAKKQVLQKPAADEGEAVTIVEEEYSEEDWIK